jgi:hypothetical protein
MIFFGLRPMLARIAGILPEKNLAGFLLVMENLILWARSDRIENSERKGKR